MKKVRVLTAEEAALLVNDGDTIATGGFVSCACPEALSKALEKRFLETGHPRDLTLFFAAVFGFLGGLTDFVADIIARKVLSARRKKPENHVGNAVTRAVGGVFDGMVEGLNQTVLRGHQIEHHAMAKISAAWDGVMDAISQMSHTMSYGLLLFGLGLCVTLLYLMFY